MRELKSLEYACNHNPIEYIEQDHPFWSIPTTLGKNFSKL